MLSYMKNYFFIITIFLIFLFWFIYSYFTQGLFFHLINNNVDQFITFIESFGIFSQIVFVTIVILEVVFAPLPPLILYIAAGILFGGFYGGILVLIGNLIGSYIDFILVRNFLGKKMYIEKNFRKKFEKYFEKYGGLSIFILRINPFTTSDLVSYLAGLTPISKTKFLIATALGLIPLIFVQTYLGSSIIKENTFLMGLTIFFSLVYVVIFFYILSISLIKKHSNKKV